MEMVVKRYIADGNAVNIDLGFVPEKVEVIMDIDATNPDVYEWVKCMEDESTPQYGILHTGSSGAITELTTAATGIIEFDAKYHGALVPDPAGGNDQFRVPTEWAAATDYSSGYTARDASTAGDLVWPPTRNGFVYELKTATAAGTSEPSSWGTTVGEDSTDGGANVWTCRDYKVKIKGAQGITMGATTQTDGDVNLVVGYKADTYINAGDAAEAGASDFI